MSLALIWNIIIVVAGVVGSVSIAIYITKDNKKDIESLKDKHESLDSKCSKMMEEKEARDSFVTKELYNQQNAHIDKMFKELKEQTNEILRYVRK